MEDNSISEIVKLFRTVTENFRFLKRNKFKHKHLTSSQGMVIGIVMHHGPIKISDLSKHMNWSLSTTSEMVKRLESQNILIRKKDENDKRIVTVDLSEEYKIKAKEYHGFFEKFSSEVFEDATKEEIDKIIEGLSVMNRLIESQILKSNDEGDLNA